MASASGHEVPAELQQARTKIEILEKEVEDVKAQIEAADPTVGLKLQLQLLSPLQKQLATLREKEERLAAQQQVGGSGAGAGASGDEAWLQRLDRQERHGEGSQGADVCQGGAGASVGTSVVAPKGQPLVVTFKKGKVVEDVTFDGVPSWHALERKVEEVYRELEAEKFRVKAGKVELSEASWAGYAASRSYVTLEVISDCKPFSSFKAQEAFSILDTAQQYVDDAAAEFPLAPYDPLARADQVLQECLNLHTHDDIIQHAGKELALRCCKTDPDKHRKEDSKREVISPVIFAAAALAGDVRVEADYNVRGMLGSGKTDYVIMCQHFSIVVVEGKLHEALEAHLGQLAAEMRSAHEQYKRVYLSKRKHEDEGDFQKVPSFGILSNGASYIFYKYTPEDRRLVQHSVRAWLKQRITADEAIAEVLPIIRHLVHIIQLQMQRMESFKRVRTG